MRFWLLSVATAFWACSLVAYSTILFAGSLVSVLSPPESVSAPGRGHSTYPHPYKYPRTQRPNPSIQPFQQRGAKPGKGGQMETSPNYV